MPIAASRPTTRRPCYLPSVAASVIVVGSCPEGSRSLTTERLQAALRESQAIRQMSEEARARARAAREQILKGRSQRQVLHDSAFARLQAKLGTMPVIEQAKGIIMAQQGCGPEEAFDLLRRASQRANVKVHVLAARMVEDTAASGGDGNVTPITRGATRYLRPGTRAWPPAG